MSLRGLVFFDAAAALVSAAAVWTLRPWISGWSGLPEPVLRGMSLVSACYGLYSLTLASRLPAASPLWVRLLITANVLWAAACLAIAWWLSPRPLGVAYLAGEALFVAGLAATEWIVSNRETACR